MRGAFDALEEERRAACFDDAVVGLGDLELRIDPGRDTNQLVLALEQRDPRAQVHGRGQDDQSISASAYSTASSSERAVRGLDAAAMCDAYFSLYGVHWSTGARASSASTAAHSTAARLASRELHDVLANSLSVMTLQASLAAEMAGCDLRAAERAMGEVETAGRRALDEIGGLIEALGGDERQSTEPRHGIADLRALAEQYQRAGIEVDLELAARQDRLPAAVELSTYRIVQEGLTNALKHAPGSPVSVRLACRDAGVAIEVRNGTPVRPIANWASGGHGLAGLRERVRLLGGSLEAGPTTDGGYLLRATIGIAGAETP